MASLDEREGRKFFEQSSNTLSVTVQRETDASESSALPTELSEGSINVFDENETLFSGIHVLCGIQFLNGTTWFNTKSTKFRLPLSISS